MKYSVLLAALLFAGCDMFGTESGANTITYRLETSDDFPLGPSAAVNYLVDGKYQGDGSITEFPWEVTIPYFEGPKGFFVMAAWGEATVSILHNDEVIAKSKLTSTNGEVPNFIQLGTVAHVDQYAIEVVLNSNVPLFRTSFLNRDEDSLSNRPVSIDKNFIAEPGQQIEIVKGVGDGVMGLYLKTPIPMTLLQTGGNWSSNVSLQLGPSK